MITEHSEVETVAAIVNETRPITPELVLTGVKVDSGFSSCRLYYQIGGLGNITTVMFLYSALFKLLLFRESYQKEK